MLHAQSGVALRPAGPGDAGSTYTAPAAAVAAPQHATAGDPSAPLRAGDTIEVRVSNVPVDENTLNGTYTVDEDGTINLPYVNQVKIGGLLTSQAQLAIQHALVDGQIYTHPTITVLQSTPRFVNVNGEVRAPQRVSYTSDMTLTTVITAAGGFTDYAAKKKVELLRDGTRTVYNTLDIQSGKVTDPKVVPGDKIHVPASMF